MGYNTAVIILNDALHRLEHDDEFARNLQVAICMAGAGRGPQVVPIGNHVNGCTVVTSHHADMTSLVAFGGNHATPVFTAFGDAHHHTREGQEKLLRAWADKMGFHLHKKPKRRGTPAA